MGGGPRARRVRPRRVRERRLHPLLATGAGTLPANAVFSRTPGLVLLWIDAVAVDADLVEEDGFPHLYAPLDVDAVVAVSALGPWEPGGFALPPGPST